MKNLGDSHERVTFSPLRPVRHPIGRVQHPIGRVEISAEVVEAVVGEYGGILADLMQLTAELPGRLCAGSPGMKGASSPRCHSPPATPPMSPRVHSYPMPPNLELTPELAGTRNVHETWFSSSSAQSVEKMLSQDQEVGKALSQEVELSPTRQTSPEVEGSPTKQTSEATKQTSEAKKERHRVSKVSIFSGSVEDDKRSGQAVAALMKSLSACTHTPSAKRFLMTAKRLGDGTGSP